MTGARASVRISGIAAGGAGVGRLPDGRAVFVPRTAPGDEALIQVEKEKARWATGRLLRVTTPGPGRRTAPCRHYAQCGGCTLEHLEYQRQLAIKANIVHEALRRIGGLTLTEPAVTPAPREFHYRNRVSFTLVRLPDGRVNAGFHHIDRPDRVVDISADCLLPEEPIAHAWGDLRNAWGEQAAYLPSGTQLRLTLRANAQGAISLAILGGYSGGQPDRVLQSVPALRAIWHRPQGGSGYKLLAGDELFLENWNEEEVALSGSVFLQVNRAVAEQLEQHVIERVQACGAHTVVDAYCGVGLHARRLAALGCVVTGIEMDADAVAEANRAAPQHTRFVAGRVEDTLKDVLPADLVILNPPRAGLAKETSAILLQQRTPRLLYVSCDPATLARDLAALAPGYTLTNIHCFDLFPQTTHVETVVELACATS